MADSTTRQPEGANTSLLIRGAIWIAIGALIAAAIVCVVWVLVDNQDGIIGRAFLTILLFVAFAGIAILEAGLSSKRPDWLALASMITWIIALLVGAVKIWMPIQWFEGAVGFTRFFFLLLVVAILQLALLHVRLFTTAAQRYVTLFTQVIQYVTIGLLMILAVMLIIPLTFTRLFEYPDMYWRIVVALAILVAVGTTLIPLLNALFAPKRPSGSIGLPNHSAPAPQSFAGQGYAQPAVIEQPVNAWPTYADGVTPLPVLPDGTPDVSAYYTGYPTPQYYGNAQSPAAQPQHPAPVAADPVTEPPAPPAQTSAPGSFPPPPPAPQ
ncbi:hypothetical protein [Microbacterium sp. GXF6406]